MPCLPKHSGSNITELDLTLVNLTAHSYLVKELAISGF